MRRTNLSLYYLAGYLIPAGLLLLFVPEFATKLLLSNRTYDYAPFHLAGVLLLVSASSSCRSFGTGSRCCTRRRSSPER